ncbi:MAG: hypothetical protein II028_00450 [Clostridia bacterium]|nr:hypothetical protein [Clostridia bacterium]
MKQKKSNLDEMQEQKLLKIEHNGCWIAFWGLLAVILAQVVLTPDELREHLPRIMTGEWIVFMVLSLYLGFACMKNGIWDRKLKPNAKTNLLASLLAGGAVAVFQVLYSYFRFHRLVVALGVAGVSALITVILCFLTLTVTARVTKKQQEKLEEEPKDSAEEQ